MKIGEMGSAMKNSWSIVVTAKALPENINIFIEHHLKLNPKEIFLFLDAPDDFDNSQDLVKADSLRIIECTPEFWKSRPHFHMLRYEKGVRPELVEYRQYHNMLHAHSISDAEWLLMMDIDELLYTRSDVGNLLNKYPDNIFSILLMPIEAVYKDDPPVSFKEVFDTDFFKTRKKVNYEYWNKIYDREGIYHKSGFFGHVTGKSFTRVNKEIMQPSCHLNKPLDRDLGYAFIEENMNIMHFESQTLEMFSQKIINRSSKKFNVGFLDEISVKRTNNIISIYKEKGELALLDIYLYMHVFSKEKINKILNDGYILEITDKTTSDYVFDHKIVSFHHSVLVYDHSKDIVIALKEEDISSSIHSIVKIAINKERVDIESKAFLYFEYNYKIEYLCVDRDGKIIIFRSNKAQLLNYFTDNNYFSLSIDNKYITVKPSCEVLFKAEKINKWEQLYKFNFRS
ncbi:glycosyltransferase family 2 protein [Alkanindiges illinoisensis]|uniref:glycosyltransferase family 2 protein n=1 Tax=Alkanindiges illinoisensis TaxID=197183 RepID=UPI0012EB3AED|nr:glycosyltransferase family 2 protein [Alkanindiges illinoisensis]